MESKKHEGFIDPKDILLSLEFSNQKIDKIVGFEWSGEQNNSYTGQKKATFELIVVEPICDIIKFIKESKKVSLIDKKGYVFDSFEFDEIIVVGYKAMVNNPVKATFKVKERWSL